MTRLLEEIDYMLINSMICSPVIAYFMALLWAVTFGVELEYFGGEDTILDEWLICITAFLLLSVALAMRDELRDAKYRD